MFLTSGSSLVLYNVEMDEIMVIMVLNGWLDEDGMGLYYIEASTQNIMFHSKCVIQETSAFTTGH